MSWILILSNIFGIGSRMFLVRVSRRELTDRRASRRWWCIRPGATLWNVAYVMKRKVTKLPFFHKEFIVLGNPRSPENLNSFILYSLWKVQERTFSLSILFSYKWKSCDSSYFFNSRFLLWICGTQVKLFSELVEKTSFTYAEFHDISIKIR